MHDDDIHETPSSTPNFRTELAAQLAELAPEVIADGKVDVVKLQELLDGDAAEGNERFGLFWPGKKRALRVAQEPTTATLKPDFENSKDWDTTKNVFIEGDNLEVLKILQRHYHGKIKMIYIDPPYNTGKDFVYPDNYKEGLANYLEWTRQVTEEGKKVTTNAETEGRYHSNWLNMMYPRLKLARNLLTDDGVIFVSIDQNEVDNLIKLGNEVFGEANLVASITREAIRGGSQSKHIREVHDYVLVFARNITMFTAGGIEVDGIELDSMDEHGPYRKGRELNKWGAGSRREDSPGMYFAIPGPGGEDVFPIRNDGSEGRWRLGKEKMRRKLEDGDVLFEQRSDGTFIAYEKLRDTSPRLKQYTTLFTESYVNSRGTDRIKKLFKVERSYFDYVKPTQLIIELTRFANVESGDIVLDFFAGSGTTADSVLQLNADDSGKRRWILVQLPEPVLESSEAAKAGFRTISDIARKRVELAGEEISENSGHGAVDDPLDTGFRAFSLTDSNFSKWRVSSEIEPDQLEQRLLGLRDSAADDATPDDLFTEILLKQGFSLTERIEPREVADLNLRAVLQEDGDLAVLAHLDEHTKPTLEQLRAMVDAKPSKIIVLEDTFRGDDQLKTNLAQLCKSTGIELWTA